MPSHSKDQITAIVADHYREAVGNLLADPLIREMAWQVKHLDGETVNSWDFTLQAARTYRQLGGQVDSHMGGPPEAIRLCLAAIREKQEASEEQA